ncbi:MAG: hypothetical protein ACTSVU_01530 [Promethearchaeota archaeon]
MNNFRLFYRITQKFREEEIPFTALDSFNDIHPSARVLLTTQQDLDKYDLYLPKDLDILILLPKQSINEILLITLQHMHHILHFHDVMIAIDPGTENIGAAMFLDDYFIYSKEIFDICQLSRFIDEIFQAFPIQRKKIKLGNGYSKLTRYFLNSLLTIKSQEFDVQYLLVNERNTSKIHWKGDKCFHSRHEKAAMLIGRRHGSIITANSFH